MDQLLTTDDVAKRLQVCRETILRYARRRRLHGIRMGGRWRFKPADVDRFVDEHRQN